MMRQVRRVAAVMLGLFALLFVNLNVVQVLRADDLANHPNNRRLLIREYEIKRGPIVVGEEAIAYSEATDGTLKYLRVYEQPELWSHITGFYSFVLARAGLEATMNEELTGAPTEVLAQNLAELVGQRDRVGNTVRLTVDPAVQAAARSALGDRIGAVVALDPTTGAVLAHYSHPTYDPNLLSSHDASSILEAWNDLRDAPDKPLLNRVTRETYPPGSTMKVVVAAAALESGLQPATAFPDEAVYDVPQTTADIHNFTRGQPCAGGGTISLADAFRVSCNTVFARLGVQLGADALIRQAERFGFNRTPPYELPPVESSIPKDLNPPQTAQSAIGQFDVRATPLQMALIAAAIANDGVMMRPHVVADVRDPSGRLLSGPNEGPWEEGRFSAQVVSQQTARQLQDMMVLTVESGTGRQAAIPGSRVGGKTGTAQVPDQTPTAWFIGFADDRIAVAVVVPDAGGEGGGAVAAPIARAVMEAALARG